jgi:hypothetical protein
MLTISVSPFADTDTGDGGEEKRKAGNDQDGNKEGGEGKWRLLFSIASRGRGIAGVIGSLSSVTSCWGSITGIGGRGVIGRGGGRGSVVTGLGSRGCVSTSSTAVAMTSTVPSDKNMGSVSHPDCQYSAAY